MDLRTLYFVGQRVFFIYSKEILYGEVVSIYITITNKEGSEDFDTSYLLKNDYGELYKLDEKELFSSKEELLSALAGDEFVVVPLKN